MATPQPAEHPDQPLTWELICARYPDRWVVLTHLEFPDKANLDYTNAKVVGTFATRAETTPILKELHATGGCGMTGCFFAGEPVRKEVLMRRWR